MLSIVERQHGKHTSAKDASSEPSFLFLKRPEKGLLANQWEFPNVVLRESTRPGGDENFNDIQFSEDEKWEPFEEFIRDEMGLSWSNGNNSSATSNNMPLMYPVVNGCNEYMKNTIIHIFSHQKHIMHVIVREVHIEGHYPNSRSSKKETKNSNREVKIMTLTELEKAGLTTGMKKVLNAAKSVLDDSSGSTKTSSSSVLKSKTGRSNNNSSSSDKTRQKPGKREDSSGRNNKSGKSSRSNDGNILNYFNK